ncbi:LamG domain-containing protein [Streptomyces sp. NBC_01754]|uniref:LamG domain-containing protein n=1 Tax=Streptomyces sp. NBC_01754 TaxID=2975930 RepID=UPI002DDC33FE|nr:LamG domain-containing protein [Streptomyces sp. NBC_01754]WSC94090.1 LamG domain-containing protein [Streptomyces sp. NBC_01754]
MVSVAAAAVLLTSLPVLGGEPEARAAAEDSAAERTEGQRALTEAKESGRRVEVVGERSERSTVYANPDGFTFTLENSTVPVRVPTPDGGWQAPDATLKVRADGTVVPKAAAVEMEFSGGGDDPLVKISERGRWLSLGWPGVLPKPELEGESALYRDVLDGVDLRVTASAEGFRHVLVVRTPEAAESKELDRIDYSLRTADLTVVKGEAGSLTAVDDDGNRVFRAPPAQMWDSAGTAGAAARQAVARSAAGTGPAAPVKGSDATVPGPEPGPGDNVVTMGVEVSDKALSVVPDADMLDKADEKTFPLYIDPTVTWGESERTLLRSDGYVSYGWGNGSDNRGMGVGKCGSWNGYYCGPGYTQRLYFEFSPANLKGKNVLDVTFRVTEPWAFQCEPRWVDLVRTNNISASTTWSSRPTDLDLMVDRNVSAGRGSLCDPNSPDAPIEFRDNPKETNENLTPTVRNFAAGKFSRLTLMLKAHDEKDTSAWKRFRNDAVLAVKYVGIPALPKEVGLVAGSGLVCSTKSAEPTTVSDPTPLVTGKPMTASGGSTGANLRIRWRTDKLSGTTWSVAHTDLDGPSSGYVGNQVKQSRSLPTLSEGVLYRLKALTMSYYEGGTDRLNTGYTTPCYFKVDPTAPKAPKISIGGPYTECTPNACAANGSPGRAATFTFRPADGEANDVAFQYRLSLDGTWTEAKKTCVAATTAAACAAAPSDSAVVIGWQASIAPERSGTHRVYVRAKDDVGRWGEQNVVDYLVAAGEGPVGRWHFDEASGVAVDSATADGRNDATLMGGAVRDDRGRRGLITHDAEGAPLENPVTDKGLALKDGAAYAKTAGPVIETRSAYTVSAWVRLDSTAEGASVLSASDAEENSPFILDYSPTHKTWFFGIRMEGYKDKYRGAVAAFPAQADVWTHLAGSYDPAKAELRFYVDGRRQGDPASTEGSWPSSGPLLFGRHDFSTGQTYSFPGSIDEVAVWQRVLTAEEIADETRLMVAEGFAGVELVADWSADRGTGTTVPDTTSGYGRKLTLTGGASLDGEAIVLDGVDGAATTPGPLVYDHSGFTVTTLAQVESAGLADKKTGYTGQVLGQGTEGGSAWGFWYELTGRETVLDEETGEERVVPVGVWHFGRLETDGTFSSVRSSQEAALDSPVRLTGVYDSLYGTISLYLGHNQNGDATEFTVQLGSGDFAIGRGFTNGTWKHHLAARITEVRLWAGAMAGSEQVEYRVGD